MAFIRTMRSPIRARSAGFVPGSLACAARRVTLSTEVCFIGKTLPAPAAGDAPDGADRRQDAPAADTRP